MTKKKYTLELLQTFCNENNIILLKDYSNEIVKKISNIEGLCKNYLECGNTFNKKFDRFILNTECHDCAKHNRNNYTTLKRHCDENKIVLLKDYSNTKLNKLFL